jgi:hypothetical protein
MVDEASQVLIAVSLMLLLLLLIVILIFPERLGAGS